MNLSKVKTGVSSAIFESSVSPLLVGMICACASDWMAYGRRLKMEIEIYGRKYKLIKGGDCSLCAFSAGCICLLPNIPAIDECDREPSHWEEVEDEDK
jgi:hypothetical protein